MTKPYTAEQLYELIGLAHDHGERYAELEWDIVLDNFDGDTRKVPKQPPPLPKVDDLIGELIDMGVELEDGVAIDPKLIPLPVKQTMRLMVELTYAREWRRIWNREQTEGYGKYPQAGAVLRSGGKGRAHRGHTARVVTGRNVGQLAAAVSRLTR